MTEKPPQRAASRDKNDTPERPASAPGTVPEPGTGPVPKRRSSRHGVSNAGLSPDGAPASPGASGQPDGLSTRDTLPMAQPSGLASRLKNSVSPEETVETPLAPFLSSESVLEDHTEVSSWGGLVQHQRSSFFRQVFLLLFMMSLAMALGSWAIYYSRQVTFLEEDRKQRAELLLGYLATQSQLGAYAGDRVLLESAVRRMEDIKDVLFVAVYDSEGHELLKTGMRSGVSPSEAPRKLLLDLLAAARADTALNVPRQGDLFAQSISRHKRVFESEQNNSLDLYAPIIINERGEPGITEYMFPADRLSRDHVVGVARVGLSLEAANERLNEVVRWGVGLGLLLMVLGTIAAYFIAGRISVPIMELARGADEIRNGNLHPQIQIQRSDELGTLADSFLRMAERLRETMFALSRLNRDLESEVKRRTRQIRLAYAFTSVLNSPIDRSDEGMDAADLTVMLDQALVALVEATGTLGGGVFLTDENNPEAELLIRAACGVSTMTLGPPPSLQDVLARQGVSQDADRSAGREGVRAVGRKLLVPLIFRHHPMGVLVLVMPSEQLPEPGLIEFVRQAAAQLAIAVSNGRAFTRVTQLATELRLRGDALAAQRDQLEQQRNQLTTQSYQLRLQRNQLREVNRLKSEFLANVSHELRTPLNAIMGYSELVQDEIYGPITSDAHEAISGVLASSSNLLRLINQILDLSRIEAGRMEIYFEEVNLYTLCTAVIKEAEAMGRDRPYRVHLTCPADLRVKTDAVKLQQVLTNLVANAIKFTAQGSVHLDVSEESPPPMPTDSTSASTRLVPAEGRAGVILISIRDTGIGIKSEYLELIFEEFRQVDGSSTRRYGGTGLGLAIAKRLTEILGAIISVESTHGVGSTFTVRLPKQPPQLGFGGKRGPGKEQDSNPALSLGAEISLPGMTIPGVGLGSDGE